LEDEKEQARNPERDASALRPKLSTQTKNGGNYDDGSLAIVEGAGPFYIRRTLSIYMLR
jgi:hypothetical protein